MINIPGQFNLRVETQISCELLPEHMRNYGWSLVQTEYIRFVDKPLTIYVYARVCAMVTEGHPSIQLT